MLCDCRFPGIDMELSPADSLGYMVNLAARQFARALARRIAPHGVVPGQFAQLLALYDRDGLTQAELCEIVQIEQPTMARTLQRMERDGLISRRPDPDDGRRVRIHLTDRARKLEPTLAACAREVNGLAARGLDAGRVSELLALLGHATDNLDEERKG